MLLEHLLGQLCDANIFLSFLALLRGSRMGSDDSEVFHINLGFKDVLEVVGEIMQMIIEVREIGLFGR